MFYRVNEWSAAAYAADFLSHLESDSGHLFAGTANSASADFYEGRSSAGILISLNYQSQESNAHQPASSDRPAYKA